MQITDLLIVKKLIKKTYKFPIQNKNNSFFFKIWNGYYINDKNTLSAYTNQVYLWFGFGIDNKFAMMIQLAIEIQVNFLE